MVVFSTISSFQRSRIILIQIRTLHVLTHCLNTIAKVYDFLNFLKKSKCGQRSGKVSGLKQSMLPNAGFGLKACEI